VLRFGDVLTNFVRLIGFAGISQQMLKLGSTSQIQADQRGFPVDRNHSRGTPNSSLRASISHSVGGIPNMLKNSDFISASDALSNNVGTKMRL
jgi:hypothetical protein